jgi:hypothetical protein
MPTGYSKDNTTPLSSGPQSKTREYRVYGQGNGATAITASTTNITWTEVSDADGLWNGTVFTSPIAGILEISGSMDLNAAIVGSVMVYKNNSYLKVLSSAQSSGVSSVSDFSGMVQVAIGDQISIRSPTSGTLENTADHNIIFRLIETVNSTQNFVVNIPPASAETNYFIEAAGNAGQAITANVTDIPFILSTQSGLTWDGNGFVAPIDGTYRIGCSINVVGSPSFFGQVYINGIGNKVFGGGPSVGVASGSCVVNMLSGQRLTVRSTLTTTLGNTPIYHWLSITRLNGRQDKTYIGNVPKERIMIFSHKTPIGTAGGTATLGSILPREINTIEITDSFATLASNTITFQEDGVYDISAYGHFYHVDSCVNQLSFSDGTTFESMLGYANSTYQGTSCPCVSTVKQIAKNTTLTFKYKCSATQSNDGLGTNWAANITMNKHSEIKIRKLS